MAHIQAIHTAQHQVATVWHEQAAGEVIDTAHGNVRVRVGPAAYQLSTGEIKEI